LRCVVVTATGWKDNNNNNKMRRRRPMQCPTIYTTQGLAATRLQLQKEREREREREREKIGKKKFYFSLQFSLFFVFSIFLFLLLVVVVVVCMERVCVQSNHHHIASSIHLDFKNHKKDILEDFATSKTTFAYILVPHCCCCCSLPDWTTFSYYSSSFVLATNIGDRP